VKPLGQPVREPGPRSIGEAVDRVQWDYDAESATVSPLVSTQSFFQDFPWLAGTAERDTEPPASGRPD